MAGESSPEGTEVDGGPRERMDAALREIRREGWKVAVTTAAVEAVAVFLGVNLALAALGPGWVPDRIPLPASVTAEAESALGLDLASPAVPGSATVAAGLALVAFLLAVGLRVRRPLVEQFEAVNPPVAEKLRTARDAVDADADSRMARRLYAEVLDDLRASSAFGLVPYRRLALTTVVIVAASLATVQVAAVDLALLDRADPADAGGSDEPQNYTGLRDGEEVLGDREEVSAGDENQTAELESSGGGRDVQEDREFPSRERSGGSGGDGSGVDSQQAEFAAPDQVEDADLVREYNRRIREQDEDEEDN